MKKSTTQVKDTAALTHIAYQVRDGNQQRSYWTRIGAAWTHKDGKGFHIQLDSVPLDGRITLRVAEQDQ